MRSLVLAQPYCLSCTAQIKLFGRTDIIRSLLQVHSQFITAKPLSPTNPETPPVRSYAQTGDGSRALFLGSEDWQLHSSCLLSVSVAALVTFTFCVRCVVALLRQAFVHVHCSFKQQALSALNIAGARDGQGSQRGSCFAALSR